MSYIPDSVIIRKGIYWMVPDNHPAIGTYVNGKIRDRDMSIRTLTKIVMPIFRGAFDQPIINLVIKQFLDEKKKEYIRGELSTTQIYQS